MRCIVIIFKIHSNINLNKPLSLNFHQTISRKISQYFSLEKFVLNLMFKYQDYYLIFWYTKFYSCFFSWYHLASLSHEEVGGVSAWEGMNAERGERISQIEKGKGMGENGQRFVCPFFLSCPFLFSFSFLRFVFF